MLFLFTLIAVKDWQIPKVTLPIVWIATIPILQMLFGQISFFQDTVFSLLYLFGFLLSLWASYQLIRQYKEQFFEKFAIALILVGLAAACIAVMQWLGIKHQWILNFVSNRPYGNTGQPNHLATLLAVSTLSALYLYEQNKLKSYLSILFIAFFIFVIALTQSRTVWISSILITLFLLFHRFQHNLRTPSYMIVLGLGFYYLSMWLPKWLSHILSTQSSFHIVETAVGVERASGGHDRVDMWYQMWVALKQQPWSGYGWYQTTAAEYAASPQQGMHLWYNSAHNIVIDMLIWNGIILGAVIVIYFIYLFGKMILKAKQKHTIIATMMMLAIFTHALLEYPIFYSYFLLLFAITCGIALDDLKSQHIRLSLGVNSAMYIAYLSVFALMVGQYLYWDMANDKSRLALYGNKSYLYDKLATRQKWQYTDTKKVATKAQLQMADRIIKEYLTAQNLKRYAQYLAYNGQMDLAQHQLDILAAMYNEHVTIQEVMRMKF
ncbi:MULTISPECIES: Wzy polymerase domain-containing protein [unclassified Acinetobacter]|uniref:PglL family O-oligosaccharyltransferase n=1 Tax=unclassified Acinetobacter TaxID=196816 RepID=UPI0035BA8FFE